MRPHFMLLGLLVVLSGGCGFGEADHPVPGETAVIEGTVFRDEDANGAFDTSDVPIPGAQVSAWWGDELIGAAQANESGRYALHTTPGIDLVLKVSLPLKVECYDPALGQRAVSSSVGGRAEAVRAPASGQDIAVKYGWLDYSGPDSAWELWHKGPVFDRDNVVLVHGFRIITFRSAGRCDYQFRNLAELLQTDEDRHNVWEFEYAGGYWGTQEGVQTYAVRLGEAVDRITEITGCEGLSIVAHSLGGMIARQYLADGGRDRVQKLMTLASPHMGIVQLGPANMEWLVDWVDRLGPRLGLDLSPAGRVLWDLNSDVDSSVPEEFASLAGFSDGHTDSLVDASSASLVKCRPDGTVAEHLYFAAVDRTHSDINDIRSKDDVFQLIRAFLSEGVAGLGGMEPAEDPGEYGGQPFLTFALWEPPGEGYPRVVVVETGNKYGRAEILTEGASTNDGAGIYAIQLQPGDYGRVEISYAPGKTATIRVEKGQSCIVTEPLGKA